MRRGLLVLIAGLALGLLAAWFVPGLLRRVSPPIRVGLLHSRTGPMAASEASMIDAEVLAFEEINEAGGIGGRHVEWVIADGGSDPKTFAREARRLIEDEKVSVIFGGLSSACRKAVDDVAERLDRLFVFPSNYEGLDQSENMVCVGPLPNQQVIPSVNWCFETLKARKFYLAGSVDAMSNAIHVIVRDQLSALGASSVGESFIAIDGAGAAEAVAAIKASGADVVFSSVVGEANQVFYHELARVGLTSRKLPVVSVTLTENEIRDLPAAEIVGHYAGWGYFQSIDSPENRDFVALFKKRFGADRSTDDSTASAYDGVKLWEQAVAEASSDETAEVRKHLRRQTRNAPSGIVSIDSETLHAWRPFYLGKVRDDGQFDVVWSLSKPIRPVLFPIFRTRAYWEEAVEKWHGTAPSRAAEPAAPPASPSPSASSPKVSQAPPVWGPRGVVRPAPRPPQAAVVRPSVDRARSKTR